MIGWGITVVLPALLNGSFSAPIKKMSGWRWKTSATIASWGSSCSPGY